MMHHQQVALMTSSELRRFAGVSIQGCLCPSWSRLKTRPWAKRARHARCRRCFR